jgi:hypothetical protein
LKDAFEYSGKPTPKGFEIKWKISPMFADKYVVPKIEDPSKEYFTTLAQNLSNSKHKLEMISEQNGIVPIQAIRVYQPPLR